MNPLAIKVAARFQQRQADADARPNARKLTNPINPPHGITKKIVDDNASLMNPDQENASTPARNDVRPEDVFNLSPNSGGVLNLVQTGNDLQHAINKQVPKDKGYDTVKNLSQYLIRTDGGGGTPPAGRR